MLKSNPASPSCACHLEGICLERPHSTGERGKEAGRKLSVSLFLTVIPPDLETDILVPNSELLDLAPKSQYQVQVAQAVYALEYLVKK